MLIPMMAGAILGPIGALFSSLVAVGIQTLLAYAYPQWIEYTLIWTSLSFQTMAAALVSMLACTGLYEALDSAEISAQQATHHAEDARNHRGQLQRTLKSLDQANYQLHKSNAELFYANETADAALRFKREFAAQISHELRTSLNLIVGFSETMIFSQHTYGERLPTVYMRDLGEIYRNSRHLLALVDDILDLSKLEAGRMGVYKDIHPIEDAIGDAVEMVRPLVEAKGSQLIVDAPAQPILLYMDCARIRQVLLNLLSNAARVTTQGVVRLMVEPSANEMVAIHVSDTGPGIPQASLAEVFTEFYQVAGSGGSAGLGLAVSKRIIDLHGGSMKVESELGVGTTFTLLLPLDANGPLSISHRPDLLPQRKARPVAVVLDNDDGEALKLMRRHLEEIQLVTEPNVETAAKLVRQISARALIVPSTVPESTHWQNIVVPIISCPFPDTGQRAASLHADFFLQKPVTLSGVQNILRQLSGDLRAVLVVDDEPAATRLMEKMVVASLPQVDIYRAYSGQEALACLQARRIDAVFADLNMPHGDGIWLISTLRQSARWDVTKIVAVSGRAVEEGWQSGEISIRVGDGFTVTESLHFLSALVAALPPAPVERYTTPALSQAKHPA
jgi:signal transduction histidine kinase/CheY-like chemotaxis protein